MSDAVWIAVIGAVSALLLAFANAIAKRIERSNSGTHAVPEISDSAITDLNRATRSLGELLHDDTRALIRRCHIGMNERCDELERRLDAIDRHQRENMEEWRAFAKPTFLEVGKRELDKIKGSD